MDTIINEIIYITEKYFNLKPGQIHLKTREPKILQVRQVAHYFARKYTKLSYAKIGAKIGNKDHATVLHSIKVINNFMYCYKDWLIIIHELDKRIVNSKIHLKRRSRLLVKIIKEFYPNHEMFFKYYKILNENNKT